jgi:hypothetical protein
MVHINVWANKREATDRSLNMREILFHKGEISISLVHLSPYRMRSAPPI